MSAHPPFVLHQSKHQDPDKRREIPSTKEEEIKQRLPAIPDLRFEYSYLRSIRPYIHLRQDEEAESRVRLERKKDGEEVVLPPTFEVVSIEWGKVIWTTFASQVLSPLLQGALWGVAGFYLTPMMHKALGRSRQQDKAAPTEGKVSAWLRGLVQKLRLRPQPSH